VMRRLGERSPVEQHLEGKIRRVDPKFAS
jgi:hypothetical protein